MMYTVRSNSDRRVIFSTSNKARAVVYAQAYEGHVTDEDGYSVHVPVRKPFTPRIAEASVQTHYPQKSKAAPKRHPAGLTMRFTADGVLINHHEVGTITIGTRSERVLLPMPDGYRSHLARGSLGSKNRYVTVRANKFDYEKFEQAAKAIARLVA